MNKEEGKKEFGLKLKRLRTEKGISQEELAKALGYTNRSSINKIEIGRSAIPVDKISRIAQVLEVSPLELFENAEDGVDTESDISPFSTDFLTKMTDVQQQLIMEVMKLSPDNQFKMSNFMKFLLFEQGLDENGYPIEDSKEEDKK